MWGWEDWFISIFSLLRFIVLFYYVLRHSPQHFNTSFYSFYEVFYSFHFNIITPHHLPSFILFFFFSFSVFFITFFYILSCSSFISSILLTFHAITVFELVYTFELYQVVVLQSCTSTILVKVDVILNGDRNGDVDGGSDKIFKVRELSFRFFIIFLIIIFFFFCYLLFFLYQLSSLGFSATVLYISGSSFYSI